MRFGCEAEADLLYSITRPRRLTVTLLSPSSYASETTPRQGSTEKLATVHNCHKESAITINESVLVCRQCVHRSRYGWTSRPRQVLFAEGTVAVGGARS